jgi:serine protease Do
VVSTELRPVPGPRSSPPRPKAWLGIGLRGGQSGPVVESTDGDSPAAKAGIHVGDAIRKIDGVAMSSADQVVSTVSNHAPDQTIKLLVHREDRDVEISVTLVKPRRFRAPQDQWGGGPFSERRWGFAAVLPHDTPLHPNDCGGPLLDTDGRAVGINIARALRVTTYALPAHDVREIVSRLRQKSQAPTKQ